MSPTTCPSRWATHVFSSFSFLISLILAPSTMPTINSIWGTRHNYPGPVIYDTGSNILSLFFEDFIEMGLLLVPQYPSTGIIEIIIADGSVSLFNSYLVQWRLSEPGTNIGWSAWVEEVAIFRPAHPGAHRLSGMMIYQSFYIGSGPATALSVATTRGGMSSQLN